MLDNFFNNRKRSLLEICVINNDISGFRKELNKETEINNLAHLLVFAAQHNRVDMIKMLLDWGVEIDARDENGCNAIMWAIKNEHNYLVKFLLENSIELLESRDKNDRTPLSYAAQYNNFEGLKFLIRNGANIFVKDDSGKSALGWARISHAKQTANYLNNLQISLLLEASENRDIDTIELILLDDSLDLENKIEGMTLLMYCAEKNYEELAIRILEKGVNINEYISYQNLSVNSLVIATLNRNSSIVRALLNKQSNPDVQITQNGETPLIIAAKNNDISTIECLLLKNANKSIRDKRGWTALIHSASCGHLEAVVRLIESGNLETQGVFAALRLAFENKHFEILQYFISGYLNTYDHNGWPLLLHAVNSKRIGLTKLLIEAGIDLNATNQEGLTALMCAVLDNNIEFVQELLNSQANPNIKNHNGDDALILSARTACIDGIEIIERLLAKGAYPSAQNREGMSALMISATSSYKEAINIVKILIENGADINLKNKKNQTALQLAKKHNNSDIEKLLKQHGNNEVEFSAIPSPTL